MLLPRRTRQSRLQESTLRRRMSRTPRKGYSHSEINIRDRPLARLAFLLQLAIRSVRRTHAHNLARFLLGRTISS